MKNSAWLKEHACQFSAEYIENWQSYQGLKLYKKAFFWVMSLEKHVFFNNFFAFLIDNNIKNKKIECNERNKHTKFQKDPIKIEKVMGVPSRLVIAKNKK